MRRWPRTAEAKGMLLPRRRRADVSQQVVHVSMLRCVLVGHLSVQVSQQMICLNVLRGDVLQMVLIIFFETGFCGMTRAHVKGRARAHEQATEYWPGQWGLSARQDAPPSLARSCCCLPSGVTSTLCRCRQISGPTRSSSLCVHRSPIKRCHLGCNSTPHF